MSTVSSPTIFRTSPLIRITLLSLYLALTTPLPFLAEVTAAPASPKLLGIGIILGLILLYGALSEQVVVDEESIQVTYPRWFAMIFRKGWQLSWTDITALKGRATGQGGRVYYFISKSSPQAYLLPMRVAGFARLVRKVEEKTAIDTSKVYPLSQPWMYLILLGCTLLLLLIDGWTIAAAIA